MANKKVPLYKVGDIIYVDGVGKVAIVTINSRGMPGTVERDDRHGWGRRGRIPRNWNSVLGDTYWDVSGYAPSDISKTPFAVKTSPKTALNSINGAAGGSGNSATLTAAAMKAAINQLRQSVNQANNVPNNYYSSFGSAPGYVFTDPKTGNAQQLSPGLPVVLIKGVGVADKSKDSNPIWKDTGIVGTVRGFSYNHAGNVEVQVEWGNAFMNIYLIGDGSSEIQFANFVPPFKKAKKVVMKFEELDKLVLEESVKKEIIAVLKQHENRDKLFVEWGLGETIEYGRGMSMMFWGGPGTGKTWGAHCIAKALGQELMVISAAEVQSSEPGATERNIQEAFKSATEENKVLFIDECDSLITTRSDLGMVLAAQVNCLLTSLEKHEGVVILATNRIETMDEALERRLALIVEFPFPKYAQRIDIWKKLLPSKLPLAPGITPEVLAQPRFTGGLIKNIILQAARLAVAEGAEAVGQSHVDSAVARLNKSKGIMGRRDRSVTGRPFQDMQVVVGTNPQIEVGTDMALGDFLDGVEDEEEDKDK